MEGIAIDVAVEFVKSLVGRLGNMLIEKLELLGRVSNDVRDLKDELDSMRAFLEAAKQQQDDDPQVEVWVEQVMALSRDTEACIDKFDALVRRLDEDTRCRCFCGPVRKLGTLPASHEIATEIQELKTRARQVSERHSRYRHGPQPSASSSVAIPATHHQQHDPRLAALFVEEAELVGIDGSKEKLIGWLLADNSPRPRVISVVGMGGLGKTTLVKKVYDSSMVRFQSRAWITVSQSLDIMGVLKSMIRQLFSIPPKGTETADQTELIQNLRRHLQDKRYLIVFDDIWTIPDWETIKPALPVNSLGSWIMVTTRIESVAYSCSTQFHEFVYKLQPLSQEQSWDLFCRKVFKQGCPEQLTDLSERIVRRCGGLPLALVTIGGLLARKPHKTRAEWQKLHDHLGPEMETNPSLEGMKRILNLSYNDLPSDLQSAFLYLSIFPEDYSIGRTRLVGRWVAEGLVSGMRGKTLEEVAEDYFYELLNRSMIQPLEISVGGMVKSARLHDIMREVIITMSPGVFVLDERNLPMEQADCIQHLAVHGNSRLEEIDENTSTVNIQSLTMFGDGRPSLISPKMERLSVLDLQGCWLVTDHHVEIMCKLHHLKYLNLRSTRTTRLPESLGELPNLQTLDVRDIEGLILPSHITQHPKLRNLLCTAYYYFKAARLPRGVGNSKALQTVADVSAEGCSASEISELGELTQLSKIGVIGLTKTNAAEFCAALGKMSSSLRSLTVGIDDDQVGGIGFLNEIGSRPPLRLRTLKLYGHVTGSLPRWISSLDYVTRIVLEGPRIAGEEEHVMRIFGKLPSLMDLRLASTKELSLCIGADGFPCLKILQLSNIQSLKLMEGAMPHLEKVIFSIQSQRQQWLQVRLLPLQQLQDAVAAHPNHPSVEVDNITFRI